MSSGDDKAPTCPTKDELESKKLAAEVNSANSWETANLGDDQRNNKFLKLMGASKKKHSGRFVIGDQKPVHKRPASNTLVDDLAEQYEQSMEHRLAGGWKGHLGLGFQEGAAKDAVEDKEKESKPEDGEQKDISENPSKSESDKQPEANTSSTELPPQSSDSSHPLYKSSLNPYRKRGNSDESSSGIEKKKMTFVKSSS